MDIKHYLKEQHVPFDVMTHARTETAVGTQPNCWTCPKKISPKRCY